MSESPVRTDDITGVHSTLTVERDEEHVLVVTLNRVEVLNAINTQMGRELGDLWIRLTVEPTLARCVVLTGAGERAATSKSATG